MAFGGDLRQRQFAQRAIPPPPIIGSVCDAPRTALTQINGTRGKAVFAFLVKNAASVALAGTGSIFATVIGWVSAELQDERTP